MQSITILGATGSIGQNTLSVVSQHPGQYRVFALSANNNVATLYEQCRQFLPTYAVMVDTNAAEQLSVKLKQAGLPTQVLAGEEGLITIASHSEVDYVMAAIVGAAGLMSTLAAVRAGKKVLLANKESLIMAGALFMEEVHRHKALLLPIDSEHNALFQCMPVDFQPGKKSQGVTRVILTASGGPFRNTPLADLADMTPDQACAHPNWVMGRKISVDSATMINKALEVIEAHWLFGMQPNEIDIIIHPQSIIHSLVEYADGSTLAQMGNPDMRTPIANALAWPKRISAGVKRLDLLEIGKLDFLPLQHDRYPGVALAYQALRAGGTATTIFNAANEIAVAAFLQQRIRFTDIVPICERVLANLSLKPAKDLTTVLGADAAARTFAEECTFSTVNA